MKNKTIFYILGGLLIASYVRAFMAAKKLGYDLNLNGWLYSLTHLDLYNENFERILSGLEKIESPRQITLGDNGELNYQEIPSGGGSVVATPYNPVTNIASVGVNVEADTTEEPITPTTTDTEIEGTESEIVELSGLYGDDTSKLPASENPDSHFYDPNPVPTTVIPKPTSTTVPPPPPPTTPTTNPYTYIPKGTGATYTRTGVGLIPQKTV